MLNFNVIKAKYTVAVAVDGGVDLYQFPWPAAVHVMLHTGYPLGTVDARTKPKKLLSAHLKKEGVPSGNYTLTPDGTMYRDGNFFRKDYFNPFGIDIKVHYVCVSPMGQ